MVAVKERWSDLQRVQCEGELRESNSGLQRHRNFDTKPYIYGNISYKENDCNLFLYSRYYFNGVDGVATATNLRT